MAGWQERVFNDIQINAGSIFVCGEVRIHFSIGNDAFEAWIWAEAKSLNLGRLHQVLLNSEFKVTVSNFVECNIHFHFEDLTIAHILCLSHHLKRKLHGKHGVTLHFMKNLLCEWVSLPLKAIDDLLNRVGPEATVDHFTVLD